MSQKCIIIDLDGAGDNSKNQPLQLAQQLSNHRAASEYLWGFKIRKLLFIHGIWFMRSLLGCGKKVFVDFKFYEVPDQVADNVGVLTESGASLFTVHADGGTDMMKAAVKATSDKAEILAVLKLTSDSSRQPINKLVLKALNAGVHGITCSANELGAIQKLQGSEKLIKVIPGIRLKNDQKDDHISPVTPQEALKRGADYLVIGRPITQARDPIDAFGRIIENIKSADV